MTLADIKRRMAPGTRLLCVENTYRPALNGTPRVVTRVGSAVFCWCSDSASASTSRTDWPKASGVRIVDADTFRLRLDVPGDHWVTLRFAPDQPLANLATFVAVDKAFQRDAKRAGFASTPYTPSGSVTARWAVEASTRADITQIVRLTKNPVVWEEKPGGWHVFLVYGADPDAVFHRLAECLVERADAAIEKVGPRKRAS